MDFVGCVKTMVFTVREAHGQLPGRVRQPLFSRTRDEGLSKGFPGSSRDDFQRFCDPLGVLGDVILSKNRFFFEVIF